MDKNINTTFSKIIANAIKNDELSHAYLLDTDSVDYMSDVINSVKKIFCLNKCVDNCNNFDCQICSLIDKNMFPELRIIEANGSFIKKEDLIDLQSEYSMKALSGNKRVYIIKDAEKLNASSSNSLLKFLEEPYDNVIAILISRNVNLLLPTIKSRCQIIKMLSNDVQTVDFELFDKVYPFIDFLEKNGVLSILHEKELWLNNFSSVKDSEGAIDLMICFYGEVLKYLLSLDLLLFKEKCAMIKEVSSYNTVATLNSKILKLIELRDSLKYNLNSGLYLDKLIIEFGGVDNGFSGYSV